MTVLIEVEGRRIPFELDLANWRWQCADEQKEGDFPFITVADGKRYELYSDGTLAEVAK